VGNRLRLSIALSPGNRAAVSTESGRAGLSINPHALTPVHAGRLETPRRPGQLPFVTKKGRPGVATETGDRGRGRVTNTPGPKPWWQIPPAPADLLSPSPGYALPGTPRWIAAFQQQHRQTRSETATGLTPLNTARRALPACYSGSRW